MFSYVTTNKCLNHHNSTIKRDLPVRWSLIEILRVIGRECRSYVRERANLGDQSSNLRVVTQDELWVGSTVERNDV